ncbi:MAG: FliO/MopB family protein [Fibrobacter sp.]|nr:FliO/MopB family protein [Fibrobacter sp.]
MEKDKIKIGRLKPGIIFICFLIFLDTGAWAQNGMNGTGSFDIDKVRSAAFENVDSMGNSGSVSESVPEKTENIVYVLLRITVYLGIVVAMIFGVAWFVKRSGLFGRARVSGGSMDVLEVLPFGQNRNALLIRVMDVVYLLGQTPGSIVLIDKIEGQKAIDLIASSKEGSSIMQFKDAFNNFMGKIKKTS